MSYRKFSIIILLAVVLALALAACQKPPVYERTSAAVYKAGNAVPPIDENVILTVSGAIRTKNQDDALVLDLTSLERFGIAQYTVEDPWLKRNVTYAGVLMSDLMDAIGVASSAREAHMVALNDYEVVVTVEQLKKWPVLLATRADGQTISIEDGGPSRIIFPNHAFPELTQNRFTYEPLWIWNLKTVEFR